MATVAGAQSLRVELPAGVTSQMIFDGRALFAEGQRCSGCHGAPPWGDIGAATTDSIWLKPIPYDRLVGFIGRTHPADVAPGTVGAGGGTLSDYEVGSLAAYVWSVGRQRRFDPAIGVRPPRELPAGVNREDIARGRKIYGGRGLCYLCHGAVPVGGIGPNLSDSTWLHSGGRYEEIVAQIFSGTRREDSKTGVAMPPRGGSSITDDEVRAVAAYIWAASHPENR